LEKGGWFILPTSRARKTSQRKHRDVLANPLREDFRSQLGLAKEAGLDALSLEKSLEVENWTEKKFGDTPL
jgi:hypothetical protein